MQPEIKWVANKMPKSADENLPIMSADNVAAARAFHAGFPQYKPTPLAKLDGMADYLGLGGLFVKDESYRFGLDANSKVLLFSTEGDTDPESYRNIVWDGVMDGGGFSPSSYPSCVMTG